jgi:hypothetical protein
MRDRRTLVIGTTAALSVVLLVSGAGVARAADGADPPGKAYVQPKTPDGQPDIQGVWTFATLTPLERPDSMKDREFMTREEAEAIERRNAETSNVDQRESIRGTERDVGQAYNQFWWDRGTKIVETLRTSLIIDPPDGKIPPLTPEAQKRAANTFGGFGGRSADSYTDRSLWERCITHSGLPRLATGYNNNLKIVQAPGYVVITYEMIHEARVIPLDGSPHAPSNLRQYLGDSRGHWEGNTLVVDVTNFTDKTNFRGSTDKLHLTERFTRQSDGTLNYQFTVDDPTTFTKPWTAVIPMPKVNGEVYEYACHEGNYGIAGQLAGARADEQKAAEAAKKGSR